MLKGFALFLFVSSGVLSAATFSPERFLPLHEGRDAFTPAVSAADTGYLVVWQSGLTAPGDLRDGLRFLVNIVGCRVGANGKVTDTKPFVISGAQDLQSRPKVVFGGGQFLVVWQDMRNGKDWDIYASRVSPAGKVLDPKGIFVAGGAHNQAKPNLVWNGKHFVIVWQDYRSNLWYDVYAARLTSSGQVLDPSGIPVSAPQKKWHASYAPVIASPGGGKSFCFWVQATLSVRSAKLPHSAARFLEGKAVSSHLAYEADKNNARKHGPASTGQATAFSFGQGGYLLGWNTVGPHGRGGPPAGSNVALFDLSGKRVTNLNLFSPKVLKGRKNTASKIIDPSITWDGTSWVVAWYEYAKKELRSPALYDASWVARVSPDGKQLGEALKVSGSYETPGSKPAVASDGAGTTLVAYERHPDTGAVPIKVGIRTLREK